MNFEIGKTYEAMLNGQKRTFKVIGQWNLEYRIQWDDGEREWAYRTDMRRWVEAVNA